MKKVVLKLDLQEADEKRRALKTVATLSGIDEISIDSASKKLTLIGTVDPVSVVCKLRKKSWPTEIISVGPAKEPEKKEEPKKAEEAKKDETAAKKDEAPKKEDAKKENEKKLTTDHELVVSMPMASRLYYPPMNNFYYVHPGIEENPSACTIL